MLRYILRSAIDNAIVTGKQLHYAGSIGIDASLLSKSNILVNEKVQVMNLDNGAHFETYIIREEADSGSIILYGPAARKAEIGDRVCIVSYGLEEDNRARLLKPKVIELDENNKVAL
jgi:aspartate 1-decarboxylase